MCANEKLVACARHCSLGLFCGRGLLQRTLHVGVLFDFFDLSFELVVSHFTSFNPSMTTRATVGMISRSIEWSLVNVASTNFLPSGISMYATS